MMNMPIDQTDKQALLEKRRHLFSLWKHTDAAPESPDAPAPRPQPPAAAVARGQSEEVQDLIRKFVNPNTDRWVLF